MGRMTVTIDDGLLEDARRVLGTRTKREAIVLALEDAVRRRRLKDAIAHRGRIQLDLTRDELFRLREDK
jgi:Arc/MetJ family transcription regulator